MHQSDLDIFMNAQDTEYYRQLEAMMFAHRSRFHVDLLDGGDHYDLIAEFPGVRKENVHLDVEGDTLTVRAEYMTDKEVDSHNFLQRERHQGTEGVYLRKFNISKVDAENIKANYSEGLLKVVLPKKPGVQESGKKITIE